MLIYHIFLGGQLELSNLINFMQNLNAKYGDIVKWKLFNRTQVFYRHTEYLIKHIT